MTIIMEAESWEYTRIAVLAVGGLIHYTIPSFPVFNAILREVKFQWEDEHENIHVFDGFARNYNLLDHQLPAVAIVPYSYDNAFMIEEREFSKSVDTDSYQFFEGDQVFVIWDWEWLEEDHSDPGSNQSEDDQETDDYDAADNNINDDDDEDEMDGDEIPAITHSVTFKCIGSTKEARYQEVLALANQRIRKGETVQVKLQKETDNPFDTNAIAFMCKAGSDWERIGYIVSEALPDVNEALAQKKIIKVYFDWIKYMVYFKNPGWYAAIIVTRNGNWSNTVVQSSSKKF